MDAPDPRRHKIRIGRTVLAWYVWLPLCVLFILPFLDPRRPFRLLHLDLLMVLAFSVSLYFFNRGDYSASVPLVYPALVYLFVRMVVEGLRPRERSGPLVPLVPAAWLAVGLVVLVGFRIFLNVADPSVLDVGYSGVIGADRIVSGDKGLYEGSYPAGNQHWDTYGPVNYLAYIPFEQVFPWSGEWDALPAAHGAAIAFDLLTLLGLFLLGRRLDAARGGGRLAVVLPFAWASCPYSALVLASSANDALVAGLLVFVLLAVSSAPLRGGLLALASAAKFAPLALAPIFARGVGRLRATPALAFVAVFAAVFVVCFVPFVPDGGLAEVNLRTLKFQLERDSPWSIWNREPSLDWLQTLLEASVAFVGVLFALIPERRTLPQIAALAAAVLILLQIATKHWLYLYVVWFAPYVFLALFAAYRPASEGRRGAASEARGPPRAADDAVAV